MEIRLSEDVGLGRFEGSCGLAFWRIPKNTGWNIHVAPEERSGSAAGQQCRAGTKPPAGLALGWADEAGVLSSPSILPPSECQPGLPRDPSNISSGIWMSASPPPTVPTVTRDNSTLVLRSQHLGRLCCAWWKRPDRRAPRPRGMAPSHGLGTHFPALPRQEVDGGPERGA